MNLTVDQFLTFFNGIYCDYDGAYGDQCFDLANAYSRWIGGQRFTGATADLIFNQQGDFYTQIPNTPDFVPQKGDIVIWNWPHVGVATGNNSDTNQFEVLEQNDPENSNCHIKVYENYNGVIGVLRPKTFPQDQQAIIDQLRKERDDNWNLHLNDQQTITNLNSQIQKLQGESTNKDTQISSLTQQVQTLTEQNNSLSDQAKQVTELKTELSQAQTDRTNYMNEIQNMNKKMANLQQELDAKKPKGLIARLVFLFS